VQPDEPIALSAYSALADQFSLLATTKAENAGSRAAGLAMAFKLIESAQDHWRMVNAPHLVALVRAGATFINGKFADRPREQAQPAAA
jgi:hypothetical protein